MAVTESNRRIPTFDGKSINLYRWNGDLPVRGIVQIAHGMGEHPLRYRAIADTLARKGFVVYANDHRGHGQSAADAGELGEFGTGGFPAVVEDMVQVSRAARAEVTGAPLILLGHSMGSFAAQLYILDNSNLLDGVALSGSAALDLLGAAAATGRWKLQDLNAAFEPARTPFDWLSRDASEVDAYISDPLCGFNVSEGSYASLFSIVPRLASLLELDRIRKELPVFLFAGDRDPVNSNLAWFHPLIERYREAGLRDVSSHIFGGAHHEVLNETNRSEVFAVLQAWIDRVAGSSRPTGG
ncbi:alpha/beta fold hydrolase [Bradyrhizobium jicamae]|uniref:alpha/beta fold hydrolase n=1 Tax=Bradyrhizobium jicamae TaxID=280332 RepID=UPI001BA770DA|nr:alpha/beta hydrolase [Bradyrhizobium jicamae]MBR0938839.1 alpha/beta hydrolase [Bradyrhizobium jicamae]